MHEPAPRPSRDPGRKHGGDDLGLDERFLRKIERLAVVAKSVQRGLPPGARRARRAGAGLELADHREYTPGDDLRRLDWNVFGRLERPLIRLYEEDEDLPLHLLVDTSASMATGHPSKLRLACQTAAALAYVGLAGLDQVAVHCLTDSLGEGLGPLRGKGQVHAILRALGGVRAVGLTDLRACVQGFLARRRRRGVVVLLSDFLVPGGYAEAVDRLRYARFQPILVQITAPEEERPELKSEVLLVDAETGLEQELTITAAVRAAYERRLRAQKADLLAYCRRRALPCFQVSSATPFESLVLTMFRTRGLLA
jgi:uncharacterized protein (DUF58 family)